MKIKTPKEFDYDLFKDEKDNFMIRIKNTGEVTQVSIEVFRSLRNEAMRIYRKIYLLSEKLY